MEQKMWEREEKIGEIQVESQGEYTLPDYLGEIKRVLKVDCQILPENTMTHGGETQTKGIVRYYVLYSDGDGKLSSMEADGNYFASISHGEGAEVTVCPQVIGCSCRPLGPRRVGLKANICLHAVGKMPCEMTWEMPEETDCVFLKKTYQCGSSLTLQGMDIPLSKEVKAASEGQVATLEAHCVTREAKCENGGMRVKGEVWVHAFSLDNAGEGFHTHLRIPFEEWLSDSQVSSQDMGCCIGHIRGLACTQLEKEDGNYLTFDMLLDLIGNAMSNRDMEVVSDLYMTTYAIQTKRQIRSFLQYPGVQQGCFTVDIQYSAADMEACDADRVISASVIPGVEGAEWENGEYCIWGGLKVSCVAQGAEGYLPAMFGVPFRVRFPMRDPIPHGTGADILVSCPSSRLQMSDGVFRGECELFCTVILKKEETMEVVTDCFVDHDTPCVSQAGVIRAVYLEDGDSLWSVCKENHMRPEQVAENNSLPDAALDTPDAPYLLDGLTRLVLEG